MYHSIIFSLEGIYSKDYLEFFNASSRIVDVLKLADSFKLSKLRVVQGKLVESSLLLFKI